MVQGNRGTNGRRCARYAATRPDGGRPYIKTIQEQHSHSKRSTSGVPSKYRYDSFTYRFTIEFLHCILPNNIVVSFSREFSNIPSAPNNQSWGIPFSFLKTHQQQ